MDHHTNDSKIAKAVKRHLVDPNQQASLSPTSSMIDIPNGTGSYANSINGGNGSGSTSAIHDDAGSIHSGIHQYSGSIHQRPGASVTHDIYKWTDNVDEQLARKKDLNPLFYNVVNHLILLYFA
ncbi:unnamed protein product [Cunninghamella echinulata]